jgi:hypothetical protein
MAKGEKPKPWKEVRKNIKHRWTTLFILIEWWCEWLSYVFSKLAFFEILEYAGRCAILVVVIFWFAERGERQKAKQYQAWQVINSAHGQKSSGGRYRCPPRFS